jgi:uncharacterized protein (DUF2062 family)
MPAVGDGGPAAEPETGVDARQDDAWLRRWWRDRSRRVRVRSRAWLMRHPRTRRFLERTGSLEVDEYTLARGVAMGLFVGLTPTVGIQTLLMLMLAALLRANFPAAFVASCVSNPLTLAPLYFGFHSLGMWLLEALPLRFDSLSGIEEEIAMETTAMVVGSMCVAVPLSLFGYVAFLYVWRTFDLHLPARVGTRSPE